MKQMIGIYANAMFLPYDHISILLLMLLAASVSAFCSASEAVFFSLSGHDRHRFQSGSRFQRMAADLAAKSGKLLPAILLWNLMANLAIFAGSSITAFDLQKQGHTTEAGVFALATLFGVIFFCEIIPTKFISAFQKRESNKTWQSFQKFIQV